MHLASTRAPALAVLAAAMCAAAVTIETATLTSPQRSTLTLIIKHDSRTEPLASLRARLRLAPGLSPVATAVRPAVAGPWAQLKPVVSSHDDGVTVAAIAPSLTRWSDTALVTIATVELELPAGTSFPRSPVAGATFDETYAPSGEPLADIDFVQRHAGAHVPAAGSAMPMRPVHRTAGRIHSLSYHLLKAAAVRATVHDAAGKTLRVLTRGTQRPGMHAVRWDGRSGSGEPVSEGVYFMHLEIGTSVFTRKVRCGR